jgi:RecB family exonuclease
MNADLTFNTIVFKKQFDLEGKSQRQSIARAINTPDQLIIQSQEYTDSTTKVAGKRFTGRVDRVDIDANLQEIRTSAYFVIAVPKTATQAQLDNVIATFKAVVADANFIANVTNGET